MSMTVPSSDLADQQYLDPARTIVYRIFGGVPQTAKAAGVDDATVYRWMYPVDRGGTGGDIPRRRTRQRLLAYAEANNINLRPAHFVGAFSDL